MRITLFVGRADLGGGARVIATYAERLQQRGHEVMVVARPPRTPSLRERIRSAFTGRPLPAHTQPSPSYFEERNFRFHLLDQYRPATAADVPDADVVVATWWETAEWVATFPPSKGVKVYFLQGYEIFPGISPDVAQRLDATWRLPLHKIAVAQWLVSLARDTFGDENVDLVPNSVDLNQFNAPPRTKQPVPTVGVMYSTVTYFKGCDISLQAFRLAAKRVPGLKLISFSTERPSDRLPLPEGTEFVLQPPQERIRDLYARCDAWLFGSRAEGFGLPLLESMACRTPVIATPAGAAPELLAGGGGILVKPEDSAAMAEAISTISGLSEAAWHDMSDKAHATASRYTWEDATDRFEAALRTALERSGRQTLQAAGI